MPPLDPSPIQGHFYQLPIRCILKVLHFAHDFRKLVLECVA